MWDYIWERKNTKGWKEKLNYAKKKYNYMKLYQVLIVLPILGAALYSAYNMNHIAITIGLFVAASIVSSIFNYQSSLVARNKISPRSPR